MKSSSTQKRQGKASSGTERSNRAAWVLLLAGVGALGVILGIFLMKPRQDARTLTTQPLPGTLTFNQHVAPIVFKECSPCHRPGQAAPFSLLTYEEVRKHAKQIVEVTASRFMPPWLPEPGYGDFAQARRLTPQELGILEQWVKEGAAEGKPADLPPTPTWPNEWVLGTPDLVIQALAPYILSPEGKDVYHNVVIPVPLSGGRYVRAVEFRPDNPKVVHHAFVNIDETRQSRRLAEKQTPPGFDGMELPESAVMPGGQLLGWQPGKVPRAAPDGLSWQLRPGTDVVLQMHLHPSGKPETVQPRIGFFFTNQAPTNQPFRIKLARFDFEIPPGVSNYVVEQSYLLPVDVSLIGILPHVHYLGRDLQAYAELPSGEKSWLIWIKNWDFNWQGDYRYQEPVNLPRGSKVVMRYTYDNTTNNVRNPHSPPKAVRNGLETTDEMAGLVLQALTHNPQDRRKLAEDYSTYFTRVSKDYYQFLIQRDPGDAAAHVKLGRAQAAEGQIPEALQHLTRAVALNPDDDKAHYELGYVLLLQNRLAEAYQEFQATLRLRADDYQAHGCLGVICMKTGRLEEAESHLKKAVQLNPDDRISQRNLDRLRTARPPGTPP